MLDILSIVVKSALKNIEDADLLRTALYYIKL